jgi:hypothetical protein
MSIESIGGASSSSFSQESIMGQFYSRINELKADIQSSLVGVEIPSAVSSILDTLQGLDQGGGLTGSVDTLFTYVGQLANQSPEFLDSLTQGGALVNSAKGADLKEIMASRFKTCLSNYKSSGKSLLLEISQKLENASLTDIVGDYSANKDELEALLKTMLKDGISDLNELSMIITILGLLGINITDALLVEIEVAIEDFVKQGLFEKSSLLDKLIFLQTVKAFLDTPNVDIDVPFLDEMEDKIMNIEAMHGSEFLLTDLSVEEADAMAVEETAEASNDDAGNTEDKNYKIAEEWKHNVMNQVVVEPVFVEEVDEVQDIENDNKVQAVDEKSDAARSSREQRFLTDKKGGRLLRSSKPKRPAKKGAIPEPVLEQDRLDEWKHNWNVKAKRREVSVNMSPEFAVTEKDDQYWVRAVEEKAGAFFRKDAKRPVVSKKQKEPKIKEKLRFLIEGAKGNVVEILLDEVHGVCASRIDQKAGELLDRLDF